jgi:hypothetical protein
VSGERVRVAYMDYVSIVVHRVLAQHSSGEVCKQCPIPCSHCGNVGLADEDHSCPCPYRDGECLDHAASTEAAS